MLSWSFKLTVCPVSLLNSCQMPGLCRKINLLYVCEQRYEATLTLYSQDRIFLGIYNRHMSYSYKKASLRGPHFLQSGENLHCYAVFSLFGHFLYSVVTLLTLETNQKNLQTKFKITQHKLNSKTIPKKYKKLKKKI